MKKKIALLGVVAALTLLSLLLIQSGVALAQEEDCSDISNNSSDCKAQQGGSSVLGNQYGTPLENPLGEFRLGKALGQSLSGIGILGGFFNGYGDAGAAQYDMGGFTKLDIGPTLESLTRGNWQACSNCHDNVGHPMPMLTKPQSDTDCLVCHTKHLACALCHDLGKGGDSITTALNKPLNTLGTGIVLPPILDEAVRQVPLVDGHRLIRHIGFIVMYAPADLGGVADIVRGVMGDDPCWACEGVIRSIDDTIADKQMWKLNQPPWSNGDGQLLLGGLLGSAAGSATGDQYGGSSGSNGLPIIGGLLGGGGGLPVVGGILGGGSGAGDQYGSGGLPVVGDILGGGGGLPVVGGLLGGDAAGGLLGLVLGLLPA